MESSNFHHQQPGKLITSSSSLSSPPYSTSANWTQNFTLNNSNQRQKHEISNPNYSNLMIQELGFNHHWNSSTNNQFAAVHNDHHQQIGKIKEELLSQQPFPKFAEMLIHNEDSTNYIKGDEKYMNDILSEKLLLKTISSGFPINGGNHEFLATNSYSSYGRGNCLSQIYPSVNVSDLDRSPAAVPPPISLAGSFDMNLNLEALDLLTSTRFSGSFGQPFNDNNLGLYKDNKVMQHSTLIPSCNPSKVSSLSVFTTNEITETKRASSSSIEPKAKTKKSRLDSRASCPPLKVRKEKLGDRIAALQQLVAPFGKTDTASVLMEAIGYIKFLQNQVETLSVPYMKSSRNKSSRTTHGFQGSTIEEGNDERKKDLRSRGLCLVPLSCMSYVTGDGSGGTIWPPPNFGGGT